MGHRKSRSKSMCGGKFPVLWQVISQYVSLTCFGSFHDLDTVQTLVWKTCIDSLLLPAKLCQISSCLKAFVQVYTENRRKWMVMLPFIVFVDDALLHLTKHMLWLLSKYYYLEVNCDKYFMLFAENENYCKFTSANNY